MVVPFFFLKGEDAQGNPRFVPVVVSKSDDGVQPVRGLESSLPAD